MLREIPKARQIPGEAPRRWFTDERMDLFVWIGEDDALAGFQLTYDKPEAEKALSWKRSQGYLHTRVDDGSRPGRHPGSPMLVADGAFDAPRVLAEFLGRAEEIDENVVRFVESTIAGMAHTRHATVLSKPSGTKRKNRLSLLGIMAILAMLAWWLLSR